MAVAAAAARAESSRAESASHQTGNCRDRQNFGAGRDFDAARVLACSTRSCGFYYYCRGEKTRAGSRAQQASSLSLYTGLNFADANCAGLTIDSDVTGQLAAAGASHTQQILLRSASNPENCREFNLLKSFANIELGVTEQSMSV